MKAPKKEKKAPAKRKRQSIRMNPNPSPAQEKMYALLVSTMGKKTPQDLYDDAQAAGHNISRQYFQLILEKRAPENPKWTTLDALSGVTGIPLETFMLAYKDTDDVIESSNQVMGQVLIGAIQSAARDSHKAFDELEDTVRIMYGMRKNQTNDEAATETGHSNKHEPDSSQH